MIKLKSLGFVITTCLFQVQSHSVEFKDYSKITSQFDMIDKNAIDKTTVPGNDFYQYACGNWIKNTVLPSDKTRYVRSFEVLGDQNKNDLKGILEAYGSGAIDPDVPFAKELGDFYSSCLNETHINATSQTELAAFLSKSLDRFVSLEDLPGILASLHQNKVNAFFDFYATPDLENPNLNIAEIAQHGMGMNSPTYYTKKDSLSLEQQEKYRQYIEDLFKLSGSDDASAKEAAELVYSIEHKLAENALAPEDMGDPTKLYHSSDSAALLAISPKFNWLGYFKAAHISVPPKLNITEPKFLNAFADILNSTSVPHLKTYLKFRILQKLAPHLNASFVKTYFEFESKYMDGQKAMLPRWKKCENTIEAGMGQALGQAYVKKRFSPQAKQVALSMTKNIMSALKTDLNTLSWLDEPTRAAALEKLSLIALKVGYPDKWESYDGLKISSDAYLENVLNAESFTVTKNLQKINTAVDRLKWNMTPQTVNANYDSSTNSIEFPAAILQPPFFSENANNAQNYGGIGLVIGHEITHGFDNAGSKFDGTGLMKNWWSKESEKKFEAKSQCLVNQYNKYEVLPGVFVNGKLTLGENIADSGGIKLSHAALKLADKDVPFMLRSPAEEFKEQEQYYLSLAQVWCSVSSDENTRTRITEDPHSPSKFRVNGMIVNDLNFGSVYDCADGKCPMTPVERCDIW